jgi:hypothetical protein
VKPVGRLVVAITGATAELMTMLRIFVVLPKEFVALSVKLNVPVVVGVPEIVPIDEFNTNPGGRIPLMIDQAIGTVPLALNAWL